MHHEEHESEIRHMTIYLFQKQEFFFFFLGGGGGGGGGGGRGNMKEVPIVDICNNDKQGQDGPVSLT